MQHEITCIQYALRRRSSSNAKRTFNRTSDNDILAFPLSILRFSWNGIRIIQKKKYSLSNESRV